MGFVDRLEALRGIAALSVAVGHSMIWLALGQETEIGAKRLWEVHGAQATISRALISVFSGAAAVDIFFVLSGFVLTMSIFGQPLAIDRYTRFAGKRLFRIVPTLWLSLAIVSLYLLTVYPGHAAFPGASPWFTNWYQDPVSLQVVAENATFLSPWLNPNAWTLKVELLSSAFLPLIVVAMGRRGAARTAFVLLSSLCLAWLYRDMQFAAPHYLYMFAVGAAILKHGTKAASQVKPNNAFIIGCIFTIVAASVCFPLWHPFAFDLLVVAGSAGLIWAINSGQDSRILHVLDFQWVRFLGRISYSFYLLHFIVLYAVGNALLHVVPTFVVLRQPLALMIVGCIGSIAIAVPIATLSFNLVERPFTLMGRRLFRPKSEAFSA